MDEVGDSAKADRRTLMRLIPEEDSRAGRSESELSARRWEEGGGEAEAEAEVLMVRLCLL